MIMQSQAPILVMTSGSDSVKVSYNGAIVSDNFPKSGFRIPADFGKSTAPAGHTDFNTVPVHFLKKKEHLPANFIEQIPVGPKELFANQANLRFGGCRTLTAALHVSWAPGGVCGFRFLIGGPITEVMFPVSKFLGLENREQGTNDAELSLSFDPASISFAENKSVSQWKPIKSCFPDIHISQGAIVNLDEILVRYRIRANLTKTGTSKPALLLETILIKEGTWDAVSEPKQKILSGVTSSAVLLWSSDLVWFSQRSDLVLPTVSGIERSAFGFALPGPFKYRWSLQVALHKSDHGKSIASKEEFEAYWHNPIATYANSTVFWLPNPFPDLPLQVLDTGRKKVKFATFSRGRKTIYRTHPSVPKPTKPSKYNTLPSSIVLKDDALPVDTPKYLLETARGLFNASITDKSAKGYGSTAKKIKNLESLIGRKLPMPLSDSDYSLFLTYLIKQGGKGGKSMSHKAIRKHLSGIRRMTVAKGFPYPKSKPALAETLLKGHENLTRDPVIAVSNATHRPISIPLLRLLGHALTKHWKGSEQDKQTFWTICMVAFWGSFRAGELLTDNVTTFSPKSDVLGSDVLTMSDHSFALWIRDPKVSKEFGDVVEFWKTPQFPDLDPWASFSKYMAWRKSQAFPNNLPLFLRADGSSFSHGYFDVCLKDMLSHYSLELDLGKNRWTGHSFRSGLPTVLQTAGFKKKEIKSWGRWSSRAFLLYLRDINKRFEVQRKMLSKLDKVKSLHNI